MIISLELVSQIESYLAHKASLCDVETWTVSRFYWLYRDPDSPTAQLAAFVDHRIWLLHDGLITERALRGQVRKQLTAMRPELDPFRAWRPATGTTNKRLDSPTIRIDLASQAEAAVSSALPTGS